MKETGSYNRKSQNASDCKLPRSEEKNVQKLILNNRMVRSEWKSRSGPDLKHSRLYPLLTRTEWKSEKGTATRGKMRQEILSVITALESQISDINITRSETPDRSPVSPHSPLVKDSESLKNLILSNEIEIDNLRKHKISLQEENERLLLEKQLIVEQSQALRRELGEAVANVDSFADIPIAVEKSESQVAKGEIKLQTEPKKSSIFKGFKKAIKKSFMSGN
jgi:hypothetical protein